MIVPILLVAMVAVLFLHGYVLRRRTSNYEDHGVFFDVGGSHLHTFVGSMQDFAPSPRSHGFDTRHWTSVYWG